MARLVDVPIWYFRDQARTKCTCMQGGNSQLQSLRMFIVTVAMLDNCPISEQPHPCKSQSLWSMAGQALQYSILGQISSIFSDICDPTYMQVLCHKYMRCHKYLRPCVTNICDICDPAPQIYAIRCHKYMRCYKYLRSCFTKICNSVTNICDPVSQIYGILCQCGVYTGVRFGVNSESRLYDP